MKVLLMSRQSLPCTFQWDATVDVITTDIYSDECKPYRLQYGSVESSTYIIDKGSYYLIDISRLAPECISLTTFTELLIDRFNPVNERIYNLIKAGLLCAKNDRFTVHDGTLLLEAVDLLITNINRHVVLSVGETILSDAILEIQKKHSSIGDYDDSNVFIVGVINT
jgi:hypothetical protein